jgi:beta-galactosidase
LGVADDPRKSIPVEIYSNCDSVEALLNGRSLGEKTISDRLAPALIWAIPNEPGKVEFIGKKGGERVARFELGSVGQPYRIVLSSDLKTLKNGGRQVATIEVAVIDREGKSVPDATPMVGFEVTGAGRLAGIGNGDLSDGTGATAREIKLYQGRAVVVVRSGVGSGEIRVRATSSGLFDTIAKIMTAVADIQSATASIDRRRPDGNAGPWNGSTRCRRCRLRFIRWSCRPWAPNDRETRLCRS